MIKIMHMHIIAIILTTPKKVKGLPLDFFVVM